jgi:glutamate racemase
MMTEHDDQRQGHVAVFDSGVGGLTVARAIANAMPGVRIRYLGDTARLPYGTKAQRTVTRYALQAASHLLGQDDDDAFDALVVACNTASACALDELRAHYDLPVLGVIQPGAITAVERSISGHIGVIGTERTVASRAYHQAIAEIAPNNSVHALATPLLVSLAEEGWFDHPVTETVLETYLGPWFEREDTAQIDTLVLGCTHYPVFKPLLERVLKRLTGRDLSLVDSAQATATSLKKVLGTRSEHPQPGEVRLLATDASERFAHIAGLFFPQQANDLELVDL